MKTTKNISLGLSLVMIALFSCTDNGGFELTNDDKGTVENETTTESYFEDADDLSAVAVSSDDATVNGGKVQSGGRRFFPNDFRLDCAEVTIELADDSTPDYPKGTITIDFSTGCEDKNGNVRTGKIISTFEGRRFLPGSSVVTTTEDYTINGVLIEGVRTVTNTSGSLEDHPSFNIVLVGGKVTWPDGTFATREANRTRVWIRADNPLLDEFRVTGNAAGINRNEVAYTMEITEELVYKRACDVRRHIAVAGVKVLTTDNRQVTIDYGDGECDRIVTITINGEPADLELDS